jgi:hypothetical protein
MEWKPNKKQAAALRLRKVDQLFFGGARGGGKTDFLLVDYLSGADRWGAAWQGVFFRQTYPELEQAVKRAKALYQPLGAEYHRGENMFSFPNGAEIRFRFLETDDDCSRYQGHSYPWIGFDELGNYASSYAWDTLSMCSRSADVPPGWIRMRATGNPGGLGHQWLKEMFVEGREPFKVYRIKTGEFAGKEMYVTRCFVPSTVTDNAALIENDPSYIARLMSQPERIRQAMLEGRWDVKSGGEFFDRYDESIHCVRPFALDGGWRKFYAMDWGFKTPYAVLKIAVNGDGMVAVYGEMYGQGSEDGREKPNLGSQTPSPEVAKAVAAGMAAEGVEQCVADYNMWEDKSGAGRAIDAFEGEGIDMVKAFKHHRRERFQKLQSLFALKNEFGTPYIRIFRTCKYLIREIERLQCDRTDPEVPYKRQADHAVDALSYGVSSDLYEYARESANAKTDPAPQPASYAYDPFRKGSFWNP